MPVGSGGVMSLYTILGVDAGATHDEIKAAYKAKAKELHPDKTGGNTEAMQELNRAYAILKDPKKRKKYDETGGEDDKPNNDDAEVFRVVIELTNRLAEQDPPDIENFLDRIEKREKDNFGIRMNQIDAKISTLRAFRDRIESAPDDGVDIVGTSIESMLDVQRSMKKDMMRDFEIKQKSFDYLRKYVFSKKKEKRTSWQPVIDGVEYTMMADNGD